MDISEVNALIDQADGLATAPPGIAELNYNKKWVLALLNEAAPFFNGNATLMSKVESLQHYLSNDELYTPEDSTVIHTILMELKQ